MQVDKVDGTACTVAQEVLQIQQAHRVGIGATRVGDGRGTDQSFTSEWLHVLLMIVDCCRYVHASAARNAEIGFVKGHQSCRAVVNGELSCSGPLRQKVWIVVIEQRHELKCWVEAAIMYTSSAAWCKIPIVGPRDLAILPAERKWHGKICLIVGQTTFAKITDRRWCRRY